MVGAWLVDQRRRAARRRSTFALIAGGHSNLTYLATDAAGEEVVVRRGPLGRGRRRRPRHGPRAPDDLGARRNSVPVPRALALCDDESVNGASFYVMARVDGAVVDNSSGGRRTPPEPAARRRAGEQVVDVLAAMHRVDVDAVGLGDAARRDGFLARQMQALRRACGNATRPASCRRWPRSPTGCSSARATPALHRDRPRRLPDRQRDDRRRRHAGRRCSTGSCGRSVTCSPTSASCSTTGTSPTTRARSCSWRCRRRSPVTSAPEST